MPSVAGCWRNSSGLRNTAPLALGRGFEKGRKRDIESTGNFPQRRNGWASDSPRSILSYHGLADARLLGGFI